MMRLFITRHGETKANVEGCLQNHSNSINETGLQKTRIFARELGKTKFDVILSSTMTRAKETADVLSELLHCPVIHSALIREKESGELAGQKSVSVEWDKLEGSFETRKVQGGENLLEVQHRAKEFFERLIAEHDGKTVLMVSHGAFLKVFIGMLLGMSLHDSIFKLQIDHSSLSEIEIQSKDNVRILLLNGKVT